MITLNDSHFETLAICALRYCQGRQTYMPDLVRGIVRSNLNKISDNTLQIMINDCEFQARMKLYGDPRIDKPGWIKWAEELNEEKKNRHD